MNNANKNKFRQVQLSNANRLARVLWSVVWLLLYRPTPRNFHLWRCMLLRFFGASIGKGAHPYPSARIWAPWNLEMDSHSCLGDNVNCYCVDKITLGKHAVVSQYSFLCSASHDYNDPSFPRVTAPIAIGERAWIAADVFVGPGVAVGNGAVVGARSSVFSDVPDWTVVAGTPPRVISKRELETKRD